MKCPALVFLLPLCASLASPRRAEANPPATCKAPAEDRTHVRLPQELPKREQAISGRQQFASFAIDLPAGWRKVRYQAAVSDEEVPESVRFEGPGGLYLHVEVDPPGQGVSADARWRCAVVDGGLRIFEDPFCEVPPGVVEEEEGCSAGDGRLDVYARCDNGKPPLVFYFGNTTKDRGVDLEVFRRILRSVRTR